jgi:AcrR family transcriptional regulator
MNAKRSGSPAQPEYIEAESSPVQGGRKFDIREAALTLFAERGYHATSMEDIGRIVGVRGPSLYNHLKSKQELLVDIMVTTMKALLAEFCLANSSGGPSERLRQAMESHVRYHATHPREVRIGNREIASLEEPAHDLVVKLRSEYENKWRLLIQEGLDSGDFSIPSPRVAVYAILEMGIGVAQWYRPDGSLSLDEISELYAEMASRLLSGPVPAAAASPTMTGSSDHGD